MNIRDIEHMWKVASNNPNHDTNWHDPVVIAFAALVAAAARADEREECVRKASIALLGADKALTDRVLKAIRARGTT